MQEITLELLKKCANNLMFDMKETEYETLFHEFDVLTKQMDLIGKIQGIDDEEEMTFPFPCEVTYLREDEPEEPLPREDVLRNAKDVVDGQIRLPKVIL